MECNKLTLAELNSKQFEMSNKANDILKRAKDPETDVSAVADMVSQANAMLDDVEKITAEIAQRQASAEAVKAAEERITKAQERTRPSVTPQSTQPQESPEMFWRALVAGTLKKYGDGDMHRSYIQRHKLEGRDLVWDVFKDGGSVKAPIMVVDDLLRLTGPMPMMRSIGIRVWSPEYSVPEFRIPLQLNKAPKMSRVTETGSPTKDSTQFFGSRVLTGKEWAHSLYLSVDFLNNAGPTMVQFLRDEFGQTVGNTEDYEILNGGIDGYDGGIGIFNQNGYVGSGQNQTVTTSGALDYGKMVDAFYSKVEAQYQKESVLVASKILVAKARQLQPGSGALPIWEPSAQVGNPPTIFGRPYFITENYATTAAANAGLQNALTTNYFIGAWIVPREIHLLDTKQWTFKLLDQPLGESNQVIWHWRKRFDCAPGQPKSVVRLVA